MSAQITVQFGPLRSTVEDSSVDWQLLLRIEGELRIAIGGQVFFFEPMFPLVELAVYAKSWLLRPDQNFSYVSMESEEVPLIAFHLITGDRFRPESPWSGVKDLPLIDRDELVTAFSKFVQQVDAGVKEELDLDVSAILMN